MGHIGLTSTRLRVLLAVTIAANMAGAVAVNSTKHRRVPEVALSLDGPTEIPAAPPRATPLALTGEGPGHLVTSAATTRYRRPSGQAARDATQSIPAGAAPTTTRTATRSNSAALRRWRAALADRANHPAD